tara:strand:+ start:133 stop:975 length:843 start_codon:yes stop_codon:yes gene_type:complete
MFPYFLGKAPSTFNSLGHASQFLAEKVAYTVGDQNNEHIGGTSGNPADFNLQLGFWAKPQTTSSTATVYSLHNANIQNAHQFRVRLNTSRIEIVHTVAQTRAGVVTFVTPLNITHTATLTDFNHFLLLYDMYGSTPDSASSFNTDFKLYVNGTEVTPTENNHVYEQEGGVAKSIGTIDYIQTVGGVEETFASGSAGPSQNNFDFKDGWTGQISGFSQSNKTSNLFYPIADQVTEVYPLFFNGSGDYIRSPDDSAGTDDSIPGTKVDYTGVTIPTTTRPTV